MFAYTNSYLETSIPNQKNTEKDEKQSPKVIAAKREERMSQVQTFLESIAQKVEPMDMDAILKEGLEFLDNNPQHVANAPSIDPNFKQSPNRHNRSAQQPDKAAKNSPNPLNYKQSKSQLQEDGQSPEKRQGMKQEMMKLGMKLKSIQRKNDFLSKENSELRLKTKTMHVKIEEQFQDLFTFEIQGLKAELNFEKEKSDSERSQYQRKIKDYEKKIKKLDVSKRKEKVQQHNIEQGKETSRSNKEKDMTQKMEKYQSQNKRIRRDMVECQVKLKQITAQKLRLERQMDKTKIQADAQRKKNAQQYQQLMKKYETSETQRKQLMKNMKRTQQELKAKNENLQILKKKLEEDIETLKVIRQEMKQKESEIQQLKKENQDKDEEMDRLQTELQDHKQQNKRLHFFKKMVMNHLTSITQQIRLPPPSKNITSQYFIQLEQELINIRFFQDSLILKDKSLDKKLFLVEALSGFLYSTSFDMQLLYRFDPLNATNFHEYIDRRPNLLLILQLANGTIIAGFSVSPIDPSKTEKPGEGILMSVTDQKVYSMRPQPKKPVVTYDIYYYILGNSEIRLKTQQKKVYSNFGIPNSTFDNGKDERNDFLKTNERNDNQIEIASYEFYQLRDIK